jgi:hypothetical protein
MMVTDRGEITRGCVLWRTEGCVRGSGPTIRCVAAHNSNWRPWSRQILASGGRGKLHTCEDSTESEVLSGG